MKKRNEWMLVMLVLAGLLSACAPKVATVDKILPSKTENVDGSEFKRVILTEKAAERIDVQTILVEQMDGSQQKVIPYAAVLYGLNGETWTYTNPEPLVYFREVIVVDRIDGDMAVLSEGPDIDTPVVTVGVQLLYGAEVGVSK